MAFNVTEVADRPTFAADPDADFQTWKGIAADGNTLRFSRMRSGQKRSWCSIANAAQLVRLTQGLSFNGHFQEHGDTLISTNHTPGLAFLLDFDHPVIGAGLDVEPAPDAAGPGQPYKVRLEVSNTGTGESSHVEKIANTGACQFIGAKSDSNNIDRMRVTVVIIGNAGQETPVDFAVNRLELLVPVGLIV
ncbi:MAG: hypothetical protein R3E44_14155 [Paracoccaceae bacterium]